MHDDDYDDDDGDDDDNGDADDDDDDDENDDDALYIDFFKRVDLFEGISEDMLVSVSIGNRGYYEERSSLQLHANRFE